MRYVCSLLILFLSVASLGKNRSDVKFYSVNSLYGITYRQASSVCKDGNGFVWVSTKSGILRLTEDDYRIYQLPLEVENVLWTRMQYKDGALYAYTNNGQIFKYNPILDQFCLEVYVGDQIRSSFYRLLLENRDVYWIASNVGLYCSREGKIELCGYENKRVNAIEWFNKTKLFVVTSTSIEFFDTQSHKNLVLITNLNDDLKQVRSIYFDSDQNKLWLGTNSLGLFYYNLNDRQLYSLSSSDFPKQPVMSITAINERDLMVGVDGQGLWRIDRKTNQIKSVYKEDLDVSNSLRGNGVYDVYLDPDTHRVWVSTYTGGVSYFDQTMPIIEQITHEKNQYNSLISNDVNSVIEDQNGNLWFATNNGISFWNVSADRWTHFHANEKCQSHVFLTLCEDGERIWAGSYASGVYILDRNTGRELKHYSNADKNSPFDNSFVFDIKKDRQGNIWIVGVDGEIVQYNRDKDEFKKYWKLPANVIAEYHDTTMYIGCSYGLMEFNKAKETFRLVMEGFYISDILVHNDLVWLGTEGNGLVCFDPKSNESKQFSVSQGSPSKFVNSVAYSNGYLWLGTEKGLCRFNPENKQFFVYSSFPALTTFSFNARAKFKLKNGTFAWGTNNGAVFFNPETIHQNPVNGRIYIQDLIVAGRSVRDIPSFKLDCPVDELNRIKLRYNQNSVAIELLSVGTVPNSKFSWKLEGSDEGWSIPSSHRIINYANIPSKKLSLKIRMYDESLSTILDERSISLDVLPPFWDTWWFLIVAFIVLSSALYFSVVFYVNSIKQHYTKEKIRFFINTVHDIRTSLTLMKAPVEELTKEKGLSDSGKYYLQLATQQAKRLAKVVTHLMDFQKVDEGKEQVVFSNVEVVDLVKKHIRMYEPYAMKKHIKLVFHTSQDRYFAMTHSMLVEKILDNLLSNAVKYSFENSTVTVTLICGAKEWSIEVLDQGIGINPKDHHRLFSEFYRAENAVNAKIVGSGIGLLLVKKYVSLLKGKITFKSQENVGSMFKVAFQVSSPSEANESELNDAIGCEQGLGDEEAVELLVSKLSILIVEDNEDLCQFLSHVLSSDFDIITAENGLIAWEIIQKTIPDFVVSDIMMPQMNGFELCEQIKSNYETSHIPVILLTALTGKAEQLHGLGLGADDYLTKPFDMEILRQKIKSILLNREIIREKTLKQNEMGKLGDIVSNNLNNQFLQRMLDAVRQNISNSSFGKEDFASLMNVSTSLLYKKTKALTGLSPTDFIKNVRLEYALEMLNSQKYTVAEVSELAGFASSGYFSTVFKKHYGQSPSELIKHK